VCEQLTRFGHWFMTNFSMYRTTTHIGRHQNVLSTTGQFLAR
jgi:hypothetical protein